MDGQIHYRRELEIFPYEKNLKKAKRSNPDKLFVWDLVGFEKMLEDRRKKVEDHDELIKKKLEEEKKKLIDEDEEEKKLDENEEEKNLEDEKKEVIMLDEGEVVVMPSMIVVLAKRCRKRGTLIEILRSCSRLGIPWEIIKGKDQKIYVVNDLQSLSNITDHEKNGNEVLFLVDRTKCDVTVIKAIKAQVKTWKKSCKVI